MEDPIKRGLADYSQIFVQFFGLKKTGKETIMMA
jgi:hypothetical protein